MLSEHDLKVLLFGFNQSKGIYFVQADTISDRRSILNQLEGTPYTLLFWDTKDPIDAILEAGEAGQPVIALGDEGLVGAEATRWLQGLNTGRDKLQLLKVTLVFLMDKPLLLRVIEEGKDLWSWRSRAFWEEEVSDVVVPAPVPVEKQEIIDEDDSIEGAYQALGSKDLKWYVDPGEVGWGKIIKRTLERFRLEKEASVVWTQVAGVGAGMALQKLMFEMEARKIAVPIKTILKDEIFQVIEYISKWMTKNNIIVDISGLPPHVNTLRILNDIIIKKNICKNGFVFIVDCRGFEMEEDEFHFYLDLRLDEFPNNIVMFELSERKFAKVAEHKNIYDFTPLEIDTYSIEFMQSVLYKRHLHHKIEPQALDRLIEVADGCIGILLSLAKEAVFECIVDERQIVMLKDVEIVVEEWIQWMKVREPPTWPKINWQLVDDGLLLKTKEGNWRPHYLLNAAFPNAFKNPSPTEISLSNDDDIPF